MRQNCWEEQEDDDAMVITITLRCSACHAVYDVVMTPELDDASDAIALLWCHRCGLPNCQYFQRIVVDSCPVEQGDTYG